jgi:predicted P-loop ATPase
MLVLISKEGAGKSTFVRKIAVNKDWSKSGLAIVDTQKAVEQIQGKWIVEIDELAAFKRSEIEIVKSFVSNEVDNYRNPYGEFSSDHPRQCVFIGTTNEMEFLSDRGKNRRFWPVVLNDLNVTKSVWDDLTPDYVSQLWAEACEKYNNGEDLHLDPLQEQEAVELREQHREENPIIPLIRQYIDFSYPPDWENMDPMEQVAYEKDDLQQALRGVRKKNICVDELWTVCLNRAKKDLNDQHNRVIRQFMNNLPGWEPKRVSWKGIKYRGWVRIE